MAVCKKCGANLNDNAKFCTSCGTQTETEEKKTYDYNQKMQEITNTDDHTDSFERADIEQNKILAMFAYLWILFIIPLIAAPRSPFARFHTNQGLVLFIASLLLSVVSKVLYALLGWIIGWAITLLTSLIGLGFSILTIMGIVYAVTGKAKELPVIGKIKILK